MMSHPRRQPSVDDIAINVWLASIIRRLRSNLPFNVSPYGSSHERMVSEATQGLLDLSAVQFPLVIENVSKLLDSLQEKSSLTTADEATIDSYCIVLGCLQKLLYKKPSADPEDVEVLDRLSHKICQMCSMSDEKASKVVDASFKVLYNLSALHFQTIYTTKIVYKLTSPTALLESTGDTSVVWQLIPHLNLNSHRLMMLITALVAAFQDLKKNRSLLSFTGPLKLAIWNFIKEYPNEFSSLAGSKKPELSRYSERLFDICESYSENQKKKTLMWPLQNMLLMLCPDVIKKIASGNTSDLLKTKVSFISNIQKALNSKTSSDTAAVCAVETAKACSYVDPKETTVYRYFVTAAQAQLQDLLFSQKDLFLHNSASQIAGIPMFNDFYLMVDCFVTHYRINHRNNHLTHVCLDPTSPPIFKFVLTSALHQLLVQKEAVSWWPSSSTLHPLATNLRSMLQEQLVLLRKHDPSSISIQDVRAFTNNPASATSMLSSKTKQDRKALVETMVDYQITRKLINIFLADPRLAFVGENNNRGQDTLKLMTSLAGLVQHPSMPELALRASQTLLALHEPRHIELWSTHSTMKSFFDISCQVTFTLAMKLISRKATDSSQLMLWFQQILKYRLEFIQHHRDEATFDREDNRFFTKTQNMVEVVLLTYLHIPDISQVQLAMSCFQYLVKEADILMCGDESTLLIPYSANLDAYNELAEASNALQIGRASQQKKIYSILKKVVYTDGSHMAWDDSYSAWRSLTTLLTNFQRDEPAPPPDVLLKLPKPSELARHVKRHSAPPPSWGQDINEENLQSAIIEWCNVTGFLCAAGGVALSHNDVINRSVLKVSLSPTPSPTPPGDTLSPRNPPRRSHSYAGEKRLRTHKRQASNVSTGSDKDGSNTSSGSRTLERGDKIDRSVFTTDSDMPSSNPDLFVAELLSLLKCSNEVVGGQVCETVKELVGHELSPLLYEVLFKRILLMISALFDGNGVATVNLLNTRLVDQIASIIQHILDRRLEENSEHWGEIWVEDTLPQLINYAHQLDMSDYSVSIRIKLCQLLELVIQHFSDLTFHQPVLFCNNMVAIVIKWIHGKVHFEGSTSSRDTLMHDLDLASLKAVSAMLKGLSLQPNVRENDFMEEKTKLFKKYFTLFLNVLGGLEELSKDARLISVSQNPNNYRGLQIVRHAFDLKEITICAMSHMLMANINSGLSHAIALGYHDDLTTRSSFVESLAAILKQGAEFHSLATTALADCYNEMLELLTSQGEDGGFPIIMVLADAVPLDTLDEVARLSVITCDHGNKLEPFLTKVLITEVEAMLKGHIDVIFRGNSLPCKVLSQSFRQFGFLFIQSVLRPLVMNLLREDHKSYEVDPTREPNEDKLKLNRQNLRNLTSSFLAQFASSVEVLPKQIHCVCHTLLKVLNTHYPEKADEMLSSTIFLRFINPPLVAPQHFGLIQGDIPTTARRGLMLMSKILQNLANHLPFKKEGFMMVFNDFLEANFDRTRKIAVAMATGSNNPGNDALESMAILKEADKYSIHMLLWEHIDDMITMAATSRTVFGDHSATKDPLKQLASVLHRLGSPSEQQKRTVRRNTVVSNNHLEEYLIKCGRTISQQTLREMKAKEIFYYGGHSKANRPVFYLILHKYLADTASFEEKLLYHIMSTLNTYGDAGFELVLDSTSMQERNTPELDTMVQFAVFVPELVMSHLDVVYLYNCNSCFRIFASKLAYRIFSHIKGSKKLVMVDSLSKFSEYIDPTSLKLPDSTTNFETDPQAMDCTGHTVTEKAIRLPVQISVTSEGVIVTQQDKQQVFGQPTVIKDFYHISTIREGIVSEEKESFFIRLISAQQPLKLVTQDPWPIVRLINQMVSKWQIQQPSRYILERELSPKDVPGTFLNIALYNCGSAHPQVRIAGYSLLCAMKEAFNMQLTGHVVESTHLCIPFNDTGYIAAVSSELAINEPQLTLEFLSEAIASMQKAAMGQKIYCLHYISPWLKNLGRFMNKKEGETTEHDKLLNVLKMLINLTLSEQEISPLLQEHIWCAVGKVNTLLDVVLDLFVKESRSSETVGKKSETLCQTCISLATVNKELVAEKIITRTLKVLRKMHEDLGSKLDLQPSWMDITSLIRMILYLSFDDRLNVIVHAPDILFICLMLLSSGSVVVKASIHSIVINTLQTLASLQQFAQKGDILKGLTLKIVELSHPRANYHFGISDVKSSAGMALQGDAAPDTKFTNPSTSSSSSLSVTSLLIMANHFLEILHIAISEIKEVQWTSQWKELATTFAFEQSCALQSHGFIALASWSRQENVTISTSNVLQILQKFSQVMSHYPEKSILLETILLCLSHYVSHLEHQNILLRHIFWVAIATLELGDSVLYSSAQVLIQECISGLLDQGLADAQPLSELVLGARTALQKHLDPLDKEVGISFMSDFNFALSAVLYKGFHHQVAGVRQRAMSLFGKLFQLHIHRDELGCFDITRDNLAYVAVLFTVSDKFRLELAESVGQRTHTRDDVLPLLLENKAVESNQARVLLLLLISGAVIYSDDSAKTKVLYTFLSQACDVFKDVYPIIYSVLQKHMSQLLLQSHQHETIMAIQHLIKVAFQESSLNIPETFVKDIGFSGLVKFTSPFLKEPESAAKRASLLNAYLSALLNKCSSPKKSETEV